MANILVCDDDREIVDAIEIYLSQDGYKIYKAYDGEQALQILDKEDIHPKVFPALPYQKSPKVSFPTEAAAIM